MSLNRYENALFAYLETNPDEYRHWQGKFQEALRGKGGVPEAARGLERELWAYFVERSEQVPKLRELHVGGIQRVSLLNLTELLSRKWGPPPPAKRTTRPYA